MHKLRWISAVAFLMLARSGHAAGGGAQYRTVNSTEFGRAVVAQRADARSVKAALQLTLRDLGQYFGVAPKLRSAYEDARDPRAGGATFLVNARGTPVKGLVTCRIGPQGASVAVVYIRADAPPAEWRRLTQAPQPDSAEAPVARGDSAEAPVARGKVIAPAKARLRTYAFPDGTGSVGLAEGWHTDAQSAMQMATVKGPNEAEIVLGASLSVVTPQSPLARGGMSLVAPLGTPLEVMRALGPQIARANVRGGGPALTYDNYQLVENHKPNVPNVAESVITFDVTAQTRTGAKHSKVMALVDVMPTTQTLYMVLITQAGAPDATFKRDLPVMLEIINSERPNNEVIQRKNAQNQQASVQSLQAVHRQQVAWFNAQQAGHRQQVAAFDAHNQQWWDGQKANEQRNNDWEQRQNAQARQVDNFDEVIRGYRTVEDTQTGVKGSVDLGNVDKIVDDLNERDPGRYRQIPLRDEADPVP
jgi:hypothetical protein